MNNLWNLILSYDDNYPEFPYKRSQLESHFINYPKFTKFMCFMLERSGDPYLDDTKDNK